VYGVENLSVMVDADDGMASRMEIAAGGVVWRSKASGAEVALVHRAAYDDWTLPKGKLEPDEAPELAAEREVREETGWLVRRTGFAGQIRYEHDDRPKVVFFYTMVPERELGPAAEGEITAVRWLSHADAVARLSHDPERQLLERLTPPVDPAIAPRRRRAFWTRRLEAERRRLAVSVEIMRSELRHVAGRLEPGDASAILELVDDNVARAATAAECSVSRADIDDGWRYLKAARRHELLLMDETTLRLEGELLRHEGASKLGGWRGAATAVLLDPEILRSASVKDLGPRLIRAQVLRDEAADTEFRKLALARRQRELLAPVVGAAIVVFLVLTATAGLDLSAASPDAAFFAYVAVLGALGGSLSAIQALGRIGGRVPEQMAVYGITLMRPVLGMGAALGVAVVATSGLLPIEVTSAYTLLAIAFAAGFSERFLIRAVNSATGDAGR
jgi:8-oxo-dGTP pyrophosphatase MutT (NUDIX family)